MTVMQLRNDGTCAPPGMCAIPFEVRNDTCCVVQVLVHRLLVPRDGFNLA